MKKLILLGSLILSTLTFTEEIERVIYQEGKLYKVKYEIIEEIPFEQVKYNYLDKIDDKIDKIDDKIERMSKEVKDSTNDVLRIFLFLYIILLLILFFSF